jgi:hypothetical protein
MDEELDTGDDLRATIESAMDADAGTPEPVVDAKVDTPIEVEGAPAPAAPDGKVRDSLGRFVDKAQAAPAPDQGPTPAPAPDGAAQAPAEALRAPVSWSAPAREHWAGMHPDVQREVHRREHEVQQFLTRTQQSREIGDRFAQAVQPHMMAIQAEGVDPITAVTNLMQVGSRLRFGTPLEKANQIAQIVKAYGVDIMALDGALAGVAPDPGQQQGVNPNMVQQLVQQQLQPLFQAAQQRQQAAQQQSVQEAHDQAMEFAQTHEFFDDLRTTMADMIEVAGRQGIKMSLEDAYKRSAMLHPDVSRTIMARQQGNSARALTDAARKARGTAVSVRGPAPVGNPEAAEPTSVRSSIEAAIEAHSRY